MAIQTDWCIITGALSPKKTKLIHALSIASYRTEPEIARAFLYYLLEKTPEQLFIRSEKVIHNDIFALKQPRESIIHTKN